MAHLLNSGATAVRLSSAMIVIVTLALTLRIWARSKVKGGLSIEDVLIALAGAVFYAYSGVFLHGKVHKLLQRLILIILYEALVGPDSDGTLDMNQMSLAGLNDWLLVRWAKLMR